MKKVFTLVTLLGSVAFAATLADPTAPEFREYQALAVEKVVVENTSGKINISPMDIDRITITALKRKFPERCSYTTEKSEYAEVLVRVERTLGEDCEVDIDLKVPREVDLHVVVGSGAVQITGIEGKLVFNVGSGSLKADGKFKSVEGKSASGRIDLTGLTSGGNISVGSGSVNLRFAESPMGRMDVKTGAGDINIAFPRNTKLSADLNTGSGEVNNELSNSSSPDFALGVKTGSGDLKVKAY